MCNDIIINIRRKTNTPHTQKMIEWIDVCKQISHISLMHNTMQVHRKLPYTFWSHSYRHMINTSASDTTKFNTHAILHDTHKISWISFWIIILWTWHRKESDDQMFCEYLQKWTTQFIQETNYVFHCWNSSADMRGLYSYGIACKHISSVSDDPVVGILKPVNTGRNYIVKKLGVNRSHVTVYYS